MTLSDAGGPSIPSPVTAIRDAVAAAPGVRRVVLTGSRAAGDPTPLSDWDFDVEIADDSVLDVIERAVRPLPALAVFWDPLSERANLIALVDGPIKVDVIVPDAPNPHPITRWTATAQSLPRLDEHFWDWTLWLAAKKLRGSTPLVATQLDRMWRALLEPIGVPAPPTTIGEAIHAYTEASQRRARELGVRVDPGLAGQVRTALLAHGIAAGRLSHPAGIGRQEKGKDPERA
jgi:predicted nucleotidyltransferase